MSYFIDFTIPIYTFLDSGMDKICQGLFWVFQRIEAISEMLQQSLDILHK